MLRPGDTLRHRRFWPRAPGDGGRLLVRCRAGTERFKGVTAGRSAGAVVEACLYDPSDRPRTEQGELLEFGERRSYLKRALDEGRTQRVGHDRRPGPQPQEPAPARRSSDRTNPTATDVPFGRDRGIDRVRIRRSFGSAVRRHRSRRCPCGSAEDPGRTDIRRARTERRVGARAQRAEVRSAATPMANYVLETSRGRNEDACRHEHGELPAR